MPTRPTPSQTSAFSSTHLSLSKTHNRFIIPLWAVCVSVVTLWPFWKGLFLSRDNYAYMVRDMMIPYHMPFNDLAKGIAEGAPRAVPQDAILALFSPIIPATVLTSWFIVLCSILGVIFSARLVEHTAHAGLPIQMVVSLFTIWNPYSIERLLQGHWTVAAAAWLLAPLAYFSMVGLRGMQKIALVFCAFTPTGWFLGGVIALAFERRARHRLDTLATLAVLALPWALITIFNNPNVKSDSLSVQAFAARAEEGVGTLGGLAGLGGIWNAHAVPSSRTALVAWLSVGLCAFMMIGFRQLCRAFPVVAGITVACIVIPWLLSTTSGLVVAGMFVEHIPGAGLFRDSQKFVALALPGMVLMFAYALQSVTPAQKSISSKNITRLLSAVLAALVIATVPTFPRDVHPLEQRALNPAWQRIVEAVSSSPDHSTLLLPPGNYRLDNGVPVLDPALKLVPGRPLDPGYLIVNNQLVDGNPGTMRLLRLTMRGEDVLAKNAVGWVIVDRTSPHSGVDMAKADQVLSHHHLVVRDSGLELYHVAHPTSLPRTQSAMPLLVGMTMFGLIFALGLGLALWQFLTRSSHHRGRWRWGNISGR